MISFLLRPLKTVLSAPVCQASWLTRGGVRFAISFSPACPSLSAPAFFLFSNYPMSKQIGFYSLSLSMSHLWLSISTTVQKQFYYVRLYFYSQLKRLLKYNTARRVHSSSALASCRVLEMEAFGESGPVTWARGLCLLVDPPCSFLVLMVEQNIQQKQLEEGRVYFGLLCEGIQSIMVGNMWWQGCEAGCVYSQEGEREGEKKREGEILVLSLCSLSFFFFKLSPGPPTQ